MKDIFLCDICNFKTFKKSNYNSHLNCKKHINNITLNKNTIKYKYICKLCNYNTNIKNSFIMHLETNKHKQLEFESDNMHNNEQNFDNGKSCKNNKNNKNYSNSKNYANIYKKSLNTNDELLINSQNNDVSQLTKLVETLVEENKELRKIITDTNTNSNTSTNINTQNNIITQNNTFNLQFFLNETCKDAMNIDDFIDSIEVSIQDLKCLAKKGYVKGLSDLLIKNLEELDITKRPLHCSDVKREIIYIRDKNNWEKDSDQKMRLTSVATDITRLNTIALQNKYQLEYPNCLTDYKSKEHEEYARIAYEAFGGKLNLDEANKKLFRNILKVVTIDKNIK